jgi:hypothetical protein
MGVEIETGRRSINWERKHSSRQAMICRNISGVSLQSTPVLNFG